MLSLESVSQPFWFLYRVREVDETRLRETLVISLAGKTTWHQPHSFAAYCMTVPPAICATKPLQASHSGRHLGKLW